MDERGRGEPEGPRERRGDRDAAELGVPRPQFRERGREPVEALRIARGEDDDRWPEGAGPGTRGRDGASGHDDVGGTDREREPQEVMRARPQGRGGEPAEPADFPGVGRGVEERVARSDDGEDPRVTPRREVFDHRVVGSW